LVGGWFFSFLALSLQVTCCNPTACVDLERIVRGSGCGEGRDLVHGSKNKAASWHEDAIDAPFPRTDRRLFPKLALPLAAVAVSFLELDLTLQALNFCNDALMIHLRLPAAGLDDSDLVRKTPPITVGFAT